MDYQRGSAYHGLPAPDKDRFFVSGRHDASVIYCALAAVGRISPKALEKFNVDGWNMEMIGAEHSPGFENTAGSLGQTVSIAAGTAHARKMKGETGKVYCLMGDGELQEGQTWECVQTAGYYKLDNFVMVIDANGQQVEGAIEDQMTEEPLAARFESFGATCVTCDGHDTLRHHPRLRHRTPRPSGSAGDLPHPRHHRHSAAGEKVALPALCPHPRGRPGRVPEDLRRAVRRNGA